MSAMLPAPIAEALEKTNRKHIELAGIGCFSQVIKVADTGLVIKEAFDHPVVGNLQCLEKRIYERLGRHPYILRYYGEYSLGNGLLTDWCFNLTDLAPLQTILHCQNTQQSEPNEARFSSVMLQH